MNLTKDPIPSLIRSIAIPASIGFFFNTMYNVVDTFYAGLLSTEAIAALSISFPIFFIILAVGIGIGQGATALIANALGKKDTKEASMLAVQSICFAILSSIVLTIVGLLLSPSLFRLLGASESYLGTSLAYMNVILFGVVFFLFQFTINSSLNAQGDTKTFSKVLFAGFLLNLILDPWFMFGGFGIPAMGISGIALATVLIELLGCIYLFYKARQTKIWKKANLKMMIPQASYFKQIAHQGLPASINMMSVAAGIFVITLFISKFGQEAVAAYGIATRIEQIALLPTIGLNIAVLSLAGQNNGAKKFDRVKEAWHTALKYGFYLMIVGTIAVFFFSYQLMDIFTDDVAVIEIGTQYLPIAAFIFFAYVILFNTVSLLQGLKKPLYAVWIGLIRQIIAPIIVFWLLSFLFGWGLYGIWWGVFIITWGSALFTLWYGSKILKKVSKT